MYESRIQKNRNKTLKGRDVQSTALDGTAVDAGEAKPAEDRKPGKEGKTEEDCDFDEDVDAECNEEAADKNCKNPGLADDIPEINLDHILSCVPYRDMLQDLFGVHGNQSKHEGASAPSPLHVPVVTKSYEESFMREPMWDYERPCVMGANCECNFISTKPGESFTAVEFTLPSEMAAAAANAQSGDDECDNTHEDSEVATKPASDRAGNTLRGRHMCVLCHRKLVQGLFYDIMYSGVPFNGVIQRYGNICNHAGEYARDVMLICPPNGPVECMPFPSVSHQRNKYTVYTKGGIRYVKQNRVSWEDFCQAPPSSAVP